MRVSAFVSGGALPPSLRGTKRTGLMHVADLHATLCQLAGAPLGGHELGVPAISSLPMWDYLSGKAPQSPRTEVPLSTVNWHGLHFNFSLNESAAVIVGRHKLVVGSQAYLGFWQGPRYPNQSTPCGPEHVHGSSAVCGAGCGTGCVFDIFADPSEHVDLAPQLPELKAQLLARLQRMREERFQTDDDNSRLNFTSIGWTKPIATKVKDSQGGFWAPYGVSVKTDDDAKRGRPIVNPATAINLTVYHVNQRNYSAVPVNLNTGDLGGDMYFDLGWGQLEVLECAKPLNYSRSSLVAVNCEDDAEVFDRSELAITELVLEVDSSRFGFFIGCDANNGS
eukprot:COSAG04_NODE_7631_length_1094_cov_1.582915_1_plen_336_part_01